MFFSPSFPLLNRLDLIGQDQKRLNNDLNCRPNMNLYKYIRLVSLLSSSVLLIVAGNLATCQDRNNVYALSSAYSNSSNDYCQLIINKDPRTNITQRSICNHVYDIPSKSLTLNCYLKNQSGSQNCDSEYRYNETCKLNLILYKDIPYPSQGEILGHIGKGNEDCQMEVNLTLIDFKSNDKFANFTPMNITSITLINPGSWTKASKVLRHTPELTELIIRNLNIEEEFKIDNVHNTKLESIKLFDGSAKSLMPGAIKMEGKMRRLDINRFMAKHLATASIVVDNCGENYEIYIRNTNLPKSKFNTDFIKIIRDSCEPNPNNSMKLELTGQAFESDSSSTNFEETLKNLAKNYADFWLRLDPIECCRQSEWLYDLLKTGKSRKFQIDAECSELGSRVAAFNSTESLQDNCKKRDVYPILTIAVISILLLAILLATFSFACLFYVIPKRASVLVINEQRKKTKKPPIITSDTTNKNSTLKSSDPSGGKSEDSALALFKTVGTELALDPPGKLLSEVTFAKPKSIEPQQQQPQRKKSAPTSRESQQASSPKTPINLPKMSIKLPGLRNEFPSRVQNRKHKPKRDRKVSSRADTTLRSALPQQRINKR